MSQQSGAHPHAHHVAGAAAAGAQPAADDPEVNFPNLKFIDKNQLSSDLTGPEKSKLLVVDVREPVSNDAHWSLRHCPIQFGTLCAAMGSTPEF